MSWTAFNEWWDRTFNEPYFRSGYADKLKDAEQWIGQTLDSLTGKAQVDIAREDLEYQKEFNEMVFEREDTAAQRRAGDLLAAGLSKTLAAGSGAGAGGVARAPQRSFSGAQAMQAFMMNGARSAAEVLSTVSQARKQNAEASLIEGSTPVRLDILDEDLRGKILENKFLSESLEDRIELVKANANIARSDNKLKLYDIAWGEIELDWKRILNRYVETLVSDNGVKYSPLVVDYLSKYLAYEIKLYDYEWFKSMGQPVAGGVGLWSSAAGVAKMIEEWVKRVIPGAK